MSLTDKERADQLEKPAPFREIGLGYLKTMRKTRIDSRTVILKKK